MNDAHIHLLLTHIPVVGTLFGLLILAFAMLRKKTEIATVAFGVFVLSGLAAIVLYVTGEAAEEAIEGLPGISEALIERHEEAAVWALGSAVLLGLVSLAGLIAARRGVPALLSRTVLALAVVVAGVMAWTANLGGQINHPEIRSDQAAVFEAGARPSNMVEDEHDERD